jgi:hypothetical protein
MLPGFNFNVEERFEGDRYETLAVCVTLELARVVFEAAVVIPAQIRSDKNCPILEIPNPNHSHCTLRFLGP